MINVDMAKAPNIWRDKLRADRQPILDRLDVEYQRADEAGDTVWKSDVASRKQALRDAPQDPRIDSAATPEELKLITLPGNP